MRKLNVLAAVALTAFAGGMLGCDSDSTGIDDDEDFSANLNAAAEMPAPSGSPTATGTGTFELDDGILTVNVTVNGNLTSNVTMAHIHGPATTAGTANIILDFAPSMTTVINAGTRTGTIVSATYDLKSLTVSPTGVLRIDANTLIELLDSGQAYVNVHTVNNPTGEIRGQITD